MSEAIDIVKEIRRDQLDEARTEIQRLHDLEQANCQNTDQHKEFMEEFKKLTEMLQPIVDTYKTVNRLGKWMMVLLVFLSVLGGVIWTWTNIFKHKI
jgi:hypothetical protein